MEYPPRGAKVDATFQELGAALFELRDALVELSLSMRDLQFEADFEQRQATETTVQQLLQRISSNSGPDGTRLSGDVFCPPSGPA